MIDAFGGNSPFEFFVNFVYQMLLLLFMIVESE